MALIFAEPTDAPIVGATVDQPKGYLDLKITVNTFPKGGRRLKIQSLKGDGTVKGEIFVHQDAAEEFIEAFHHVLDYGISVA